MSKSNKSTVSNEDSSVKSQPIVGGYFGSIFNWGKEEVFRMDDFISLKIIELVNNSASKIIINKSNDSLNQYVIVKDFTRLLIKNVRIISCIW